MIPLDWATHISMSSSTIIMSHYLGVTVILFVFCLFCLLLFCFVCLFALLFVCRIYLSVRIIQFVCSGVCIKYGQNTISLLESEVSLSLCLSVCPPCPPLSSHTRTNTLTEPFVVAGRFMQRAIIFQWYPADNAT